VTPQDEARARGVTPQDEARAVRAGVGLFRLADRGVVRVTGADRVRWLDGMLSNDVAGLVPAPGRSGCHALLLTRQGRIVADLHVLLRPDALWLETRGPFVATVLATLGRFVVADDVALVDASGAWERLSLEGPAAPRVLEEALRAPLPLLDDAGADAVLADTALVVAAFGFGGLPARQLFVPAGAGRRVAAALREAGERHGMVEAGAQALEILRIEAGLPQLGVELSQEVLPAEARLERAISSTKGCYTGQEVVARMASRARVSHLLVGLALEGGELPAEGAAIELEGRQVGELTSRCVSPRAGAIALGFVRAAHAEPGTRVSVAGRPARVAALPFVPETPR
jgi:aminomethyltransferase